MAALILTPAEVWRAPEVDATISGFDSIQIYASRDYGSSDSGSVEIDRNQLTIAALPTSNPLAHLVTSPIGFRDQFEVVVTRADQGTVPLVVAVWNGYENHRFQFLFEAYPTRRVILQQLKNGVLVEETVLGVYTLDQPYIVAADVDRIQGTASLEVTSRHGEVFSGTAILVEGRGQEFDSHVISEPVQVVGGKTYSLRALINPLTDGASGLSLEWLDDHGKRIDVSSSWSYRYAVQGWSGVELLAQAPPEASQVIVELATTQESRVLFGDVRLAAEGDPVPLENADFSQGSRGWRRAEGQQPLETRDFAVRTFKVDTSADEWPELFASARMALTIEASSTSGLSVVRLTNRTLQAKHQRWLAVLVDDWRAKVLTLLLGAAGLIFLLLERQPMRLLSGAFRQLLGTLSHIRRRRLVLFVLVVFFSMNGLLSRYGSMNADVVGAKVWAHAAANRGLPGLYLDANFASAEAEQWLGLPLQEAGYPYGPPLAYITWLQGVFHQLFLTQSGHPDSGLGYILLARVTNAVFAVLCAGVVYFLLVKVVDHRRALIGALAFLMNPAVWFAGSVWGSSQTVSLIFMLLTVMFAVHKRFVPAWTLLLISAAARPQYLIPLAVLAAYLFACMPTRATILSLARAVICFFLLMLPASLTISPTLPVDNLYNAFFMHLGEGNDDWTKPLSWGGLSVWPLLIGGIYDVSGVDRALFPATVEFFAGITFFDFASLVTMIAALALVALAWIAGRRAPDGSLAPLLVAAAATLLFTLKTGTPTYHYVFPLGLAIASRGLLADRLYGWTVALLTTTTLVSMYVMGSYWLTRHPTWGTGLYDPSSSFATWFAQIALSDAYVTLGCLVNLFVAGALVYGVILRLIANNQITDQGRAFPVDDAARGPARFGSSDT